jgi:hypothetical protein
LKFIKILCLCICFIPWFSGAQQVIKGLVVEKDSTRPMPFVFVINKSNGNGTMSDNEGRFALSIKSDDTLICSFVGYAKLNVPVKKLLPGENGVIKLIMQPLPVLLNEVYVTTFKFRPYEKEYMRDIIEKSKVQKIDYATSPITALYMKYSKEGRQITKLAKIFEDLLIEEQVQKKLSKEILIKLTKDDKIDYQAFRKYCYYVNDFYILTHDGVELYSKVMDCYKKWKEEGR